MLRGEEFPGVERTALALEKGPVEMESGVVTTGLLYEACGGFGT